MFLRLFTINISFGNIKTRFSVLEHQRPAEKCSVDSMLNLYSEKSCLLRKIVSFLDNLQQLNIGSDKINATLIEVNANYEFPSGFLLLAI